MFDSTADSDGDGTGDGGGISIYVGFTMGTYYNVANSIIAGNNDGSPGSKAPDCAGLAGTIISAGYNLIGKNDGFNWVDTTGDRVGTSAAPLDLLRLGPLTGTPGSPPPTLPPTNPSLPRPITCQMPSIPGPCAPTI